MFTSGSRKKTSSSTVIMKYPGSGQIPHNNKPINISA
jgi:hypothetical protein